MKKNNENNLVIAHLNIKSGEYSCINLLKEYLVVIY